MQWDHLHQFFEGSEKYLHKTVVKTKSDIPPNEDPTSYITEKEDYTLRQEAMSRNTDICNFYFKTQLDLLFTHVLQVLLYSKCRRNGSSRIRHSLGHEHWFKNKAVKTGFVYIWLLRSAHFLHQLLSSAAIRLFHSTFL